MYLHICLNLSIWSIDGANLNNQMWTLSKILNTFLELLIMEFGPVRVAQRNSMYLSHILVIFSIARFWLNILYAKVSVRNIREGIFRGNIFRKKQTNRNSTDFCRNDWGKHFKDFLCNKQVFSSYLYGYGLFFVVSLLLRQMFCQHAATRTWSGGRFGAPVTLSMSVPGGSFQKGS